MKFIYKLLAFIGFIALLGLIIAYGRGYRWNFKNKSLNPNGIISINSTPKAAKIYLNDELKGVTDMNLVLSPGSYKIEIKKDGFTSWNKTIKLKGELVYSVDAQLFPLNPSLSPLTNLGIIKTVSIDQTEKIIVFSENNNPAKDGIYIFEASKRPLSLFPPLKLLVLKENIPLENIDLLNTQIYFSADYKEAIFDFNSDTSENRAFLFSIEGDNTNLFDVTNSKDSLIAAYEEEKTKEINKVLETFPKEIYKIATDSFKLINFSPDKTKFFYQTSKDIKLPLIINPPLVMVNQTENQRNLTENSFYIYDKKEDKNYLIRNSQFAIGNLPQWYPDSRHLVFVESKKISIVNYDDSNKQIIYSGPFEKSFFIITSDGKIITLTNLNPENNPFPDLYSIGVK